MSSVRCAWWMCLPVIVLITAGLCAGQDVEPPPAKPVNIQDLSWLAGHWQGKLGSSDIEEVWTAPAGQTLMGMFRLVRGDKTTMYELCAIEPAAAGPQLVIRHFGPALAPREQQAMSFALTRHGDQEAAFVRRTADSKETLTYRCPTVDQLEVTLHKEQGDQKSSVVFSFVRKR